MSKARRIIVAGGARGLGREIVNSLVDAGCEVWAADVLEITATRAQHRAHLDVTDPKSIESLISEVDAACGLDALVNNAAITPLASWDELDLETWKKTLDVNLTGTFLCSQAAARSMRSRNSGGSIVNIASVTFFQ